MSLFGGVKSPTTTTTTETRSATGQSYADRGSQSLSGFQLQDSASVQLTDLGAVSRTFDFLDKLIPKTLEAGSAAQSQVASAFQNSADRAGGVDADTVVKLGIVGLVVLGALAFMGSRK